MTGPTPGRLALARQVAALSAKGLTQRVISERLGISRSYVSELLHDPGGAEARARKDGYRLPCPECGEPMTGSDGISGAPHLCAECAARAQHEARYWTRDTIIKAFVAFHAGTGRSPTSVDTFGLTPSIRRTLSAARIAEIEMSQHLKLPAPELVSREFGSWEAAIAAAGLEAAARGGRSHRMAYNAPVRDALVERLREGPATLKELGVVARAAGSESADTAKLASWLLRPLRQGGYVFSDRRIYKLVSEPPTRQLRSGGTVMAREYMVLSRNGKGWVEHGNVEAMTPELAVEKAAEEPGEYVAVPAPQWRAMKVEPVTRLGVVPSA